MRGLSSQLGILRLHTAGCDMLYNQAMTFKHHESYTMSTFDVSFCSSLISIFEKKKKKKNKTSMSYEFHFLSENFNEHANDVFLVSLQCRLLQKKWCRVLIMMLVYSDTSMLHAKSPLPPDQDIIRK